MTQFKQAEFLKELADRSEAMTAKATVLTENLTAAQWNIKPRPKAWSLGQVVEHLVLTNEHYVREMQAALGGRSLRPATGQFRVSWLGNMFYRRLQPTDEGTIKPVTAPGFLRPAENLSDYGSIWKTFLVQQRSLEEIINRAGSLDLNAVKIPSALSKVLKFSLGDVLRIIVAHNDRHLLQMQKIKRAIESK